VQGLVHPGRPVYRHGLVMVGVMAAGV